ncbi:hypothetical protein Poly30_00290 [Planctomycetes bacterium Poly30]|uniref:TPM domain-containing protein n=1 Tax=Saltatorellus ferox TaxID=2528018 RepID=A0A518EKC7_9BACT|nr:hypothetical protein Poly30_00290 [Planctomycetes bacterium Poly30]
MLSTPHRLVSRTLFRHAYWLGAFVAAVLLLSSPAAATQAVPAAEGWVTDLGDLISPAKEIELEALMESYRNGSGHEIAVLTVPSLGGRNIEELALRTAREWKLGREGENDGALLVLAAAERKTRIEVGRGLEGSIPDAIASRILRNILQPRLRAGDVDGGVDAAVRALHAAAGGDYGPVERASSNETFVWQDLLVIGAMILFFVFISRRRRKNPQAWRGGRGGVGPVIIGGPGGFGGGGFGGSSGGGFGGFGGGGGFSGGGASGGW